MLPYHLDVYQLEHANELQREAQRDRLAKQALAGRKVHSPLHRRTLRWLGRWMVLWGSHLQQRYGATAVAPMPRVEDCGH
jgi:hypothetical protein